MGQTLERCATGRGYPRPVEPSIGRREYVLRFSKTTERGLVDLDLKSEIALIHPPFLVRSAPSARKTKSPDLAFNPFIVPIHCHK